MLLSLIVKLYELANERRASVEIKALIKNLLEENDLIDEKKVPDWFLAFIKRIISKTLVKRTFYEHNKNHGDVSNLLAELETLIEADWDDYGEAVEVSFNQLNIHACWSRENDFYEISPLNTLVSKN